MGFLQTVQFQLRIVANVCLDYLCGKELAVVGRVVAKPTMQAFLMCTPRTCVNAVTPTSLLVCLEVPLYYRVAR